MPIAGDQPAVQRSITRHLRNTGIRYPNQVWAGDITYLRLPGGHVNLVVVLDLYSRKVLPWRVSNTLDVEFGLMVIHACAMGHTVMFEFRPRFIFSICRSLCEDIVQSDRMFCLADNPRW